MIHCIWCVNEWNFWYFNHRRPMTLKLFFYSFELKITYAKLYPSIPMLSFSYLRIWAFFESSIGAAKEAAMTIKNTAMSFILIRKVLVCLIRTWLFKAFKLHWLIKSKLLGFIYHTESAPCWHHRWPNVDNSKCQFVRTNFTTSNTKNRRKKLIFYISIYIFLIFIFDIFRSHKFSKCRKRLLKTILW